MIAFSALGLAGALLVAQAPDPSAPPPERDPVLTERFFEAARRWSRCVYGLSAKLEVSGEPVADVAKDAMGACTTFRSDARELNVQRVMLNYDLNRQDAAVAADAHMLVYDAQVLGEAKRQITRARAQHDEAP